MAQEIKLDTTEWSNFIEKLSGRTRKFIDFLKVQAATIGFANIVDHFDKQEGPSGAWPKRSSSTDRMYDLIGSGQRKPPPGFSAGSFSSTNKLLQLTGKLRQSIFPGRGGIKVVGSSGVRMLAGTNYSLIHDEGSGKIPQREFMWLSDDTQQKMINNILNQWVDE